MVFSSFPHTLTKHQRQKEASAPLKTLANPQNRGVRGLVSCRSIDAAFLYAAAQGATDLQLYRSLYVKPVSPEPAVATPEWGFLPPNLDQSGDARRHPTGEPSRLGLRAALILSASTCQDIYPPRLVLGRLAPGR